MSKGKRKRRPSGHSGPTTPDPAAVLNDLEARADEIDAADGGAAGPIWGAVHKLLLKTEASPPDAARLIATRDLDGLRTLIQSLRGEATEPETAPAAGDASAHDIPQETLKKAYRAFRKRLKLTQLDHESKLGVGPMSGGKKADFQAIMAPREFPDEVWNALVAEGRLKPAGRGFYMLTDHDAE